MKMSGFSDGKEYTVYSGEFGDAGKTFSNEQQAYLYLQILITKGYKAYISVDTKYSM